MPSGFVLVVDHDDEPSAISRRLKEAALACGYFIRPLGPRAWIGTTGPRPPRLQRLGGWMMVGDVIPFSRADVHDASDDEILDTVWGRFTAIRLGADDHPQALLRDPSGAFECLLWRGSAVTVAASDIPDWLIQTLGLRLTLDTDRLADQLVDPLQAWGGLSLKGIDALLPGVLVDLCDLSQRSLWRPSEAAHRRHGIPAAEHPTALLNVIDIAVSGLADAAGSVGCEVSGGLDSSLVASSLVANNREARVWMNMYGADIETDERIYAMALAERLVIAPKFIKRREDRFTAEALRAISQGPRPGYYGIDYLHDQDCADVWRASGVRAVLTGKGGDTILVSGFDEAVLTDLWRTKGPQAMIDPVLARIAIATGQSIWSLLRSQIQGSEKAAPIGNRLLNKKIPQPLPHPWLADIDDLAPGKHRQIASLVDGLCFNSSSFQTDTVDVMHPLLARPVIDLCLSLSTAELTQKKGDRRLAREAFRGRLPPVIRRRQTKGDHTSFFGRMIADSLGLIRPLILDGWLMQAGLLDRAVCEAVLKPEVLIWKGGYGDLLNLIVVEAWASTWDRRLKNLT